MATCGGRGSERYTGKMNERDFIGEVDVQNPAYLTAVSVAQRPDGYVTFRAALRLAKQHQPWDPTNPQKDFSRDLRLEVIDRLGLATETYDRVKCYTAVGTPFDILHGVDGFLELEDPATRTVRRVTFDLSLRDKGGQKADLLIPELPDPQGEETAYLSAVKQHGEAVVAQLQAVSPEPLDGPA